MSEENQGSFLNGFTLGLFAGAAGYFLFATNKGSDVRKQLAAEWEKAKGELEKDGVLEPGKSLRDLVNSGLAKISATPKNNQVKTKKIKSKEATSRQSLKQEKVSKKKFKGI